MTELFEWKDPNPKVKQYGTSGALIWNIA